MALLPWWDVKQAVVEMERCAKLGMRGININPDPHDHKGNDGQQLPDLIRFAVDALFSEDDEIRLDFRKERFSFFAPFDPGHPIALRLKVIGKKDA